MLLNRKTAGCEDIREHLFEYIDGTLTKAEAAVVEAHIAECEACRRELSDRREMLSLVKSSAGGAPSALYGAVMAKVEKTPQDKKILTPRIRMKPWMGSLAAVAAAVMIIVVGRGFIEGGASAEMLDKAPGDARVFDDDIFDANAEAAGNADAILPDKVQYNYADADIYGSASEDRIVETTSSFAGYSPMPADTAAADKQNEDAVGASSISSDVLDGVFAACVSEDSALLVCAKEELEGIVPMSEAQSLSVEGVSCIYYAVDTDAIVMFTGYLEVLEHRGAAYRAYVPTDAEFDKCELILVTDTKE